MILEIVKYPDERLKVVCEPVEEITDEIRQLCDDMLETMYESAGVGLAGRAPDRRKQAFAGHGPPGRGRGEKAQGADKPQT